MSRWTIARAYFVARAYFERIHRILTVVSRLHVRDYECFGWVAKKMGSDEDEC